MGKLLSSVSPRALSIGTGMLRFAMPGIGAVVALASTHKGQVLLDGVAEGAARGIGEMGDGISGIFNKVTGRKASAGPSYSDSMANSYRAGLKAVTGSSGPEIRPEDKGLHEAGKFVGDIATYFIPIPGGVALKGVLKIGALEARVGGVATKLLSHATGTGKVGGWVASKVGQGLVRIPGDLAMSARTVSSLGLSASIPTGGGAHEVPSGLHPGRSFPGGRLIPASDFTVSAGEPRTAQFFSKEEVTSLQTTLGFKGDDADGVLGRDTAHAIDKKIRSEVDPEKLSPQQRTEMIANMRILAADLERAPPAHNTRDPRVMEFQVNAYALNLYGHNDGGTIDGLKGYRTENAMAKLNEIAPDPAIKMAAGPQLELSKS